MAEEILQSAKTQSQEIKDQAKAYVQQMKNSLQPLREKSGRYQQQLKVFYKTMDYEMEQLLKALDEMDQAIKIEK